VAELGYGASYRVLDAQNFGVPQRRRRVFVVGHLGDWKPTAEVLFESESLQWHPKKSKKAREDSTGYIEGGFGAYNQSDVGGTTKASGGVLGGGSETFIHVADKAPTLTSSAAGFSRPGNDSTADSQYIALAENTIGRQPLNGGNGNGFTENGPMYTLNATGVHGVAHNPISWDSELNPNVNKMGTLVRGGQGGRCDGVMQTNMAVRRLTPVECERLQGFPDNYTNIKENCPDGPRYKAMGNSMAVPVMRWIGTRINNYKEDTDAV
jgi:DNA (cytosine-5)-methyltransferase 1